MPKRFAAKILFKPRSATVSHNVCAIARTGQPRGGSGLHDGRRTRRSKIKNGRTNLAKGTDHPIRSPKVRTLIGGAPTSQAKRSSRESRATRSMLEG